MCLVRELVTHSWGFKITKLDTTPTNRKLFNFLCKTVKMPIHVFKTLAAREPSFVFDWPCQSRRVCRLVLTCKRTYSVQLTNPEIDSNWRVYCRRCDARVVDAAYSRKRHWAYNSILSPEARVERAKQSPGSLDCPVPKNLAQSHVTIVKLQRAGVMVKVDEFIGESRNFATYDYEQFFNRRGEKEDTLISVTYQIRDEKQSTTKLFYANEHVNVVAAFLDFVIDLAKRNADYLRVHRFAPYFGRLVHLELVHQRNPLRLRTIGQAKRALNRLVDQFPIVDVNSASCYPPVKNLIWLLDPYAYSYN